MLACWFESLDDELQQNLVCMCEVLVQRKERE